MSGTVAQKPMLPMRKVGLSAFALVFLLALLAWWLTLAPRPMFYLTTCFQDANGVKVGAPVKIAGVDVGYVRKLRAQPQDAACPGFVEMAFTAGLQAANPSRQCGFLGFCRLARGNLPRCRWHPCFGGTGSGWRQVAKPPESPTLFGRRGSCYPHIASNRGVDPGAQRHGESLGSTAG